jgi:hypothetical protein
MTTFFGDPASPSSWAAAPLLPRTSPARFHAKSTIRPGWSARATNRSRGISPIMSTCTIYRPNSLRMRTYAMGDFLKAFGMNTYAKYTGRRVPPTPKNQKNKIAAWPSCIPGTPFRVAFRADFTLDGDSRGKLPLLIRAVEADRSSCRVAEGFGPDEATTTGPAVFNWSQVPIPARFAGDMKSRRICLFSLVSLNPERGIFFGAHWARRTPGRSV